MRRLGAIECEEVVNGEELPWIIMFHGYGANCQDLLDLAHAIPGGEKFNWLFPNGFLEVPIGPGWTGRAWWNINFNDLQKDYSDFTPAGLELAYDKASKMIAALKVDWNKIIIGGFSQGAMLATELYLRSPQASAGLIILSGTTVHAPKWRELALQKAGEKFFMSHGELDDILQIRLARKLETILTQAGLKGRLFSFQGGHEIPSSILIRAGEYLKQVQNDKF